jgi:hypothetical protein
MSNRVEVPFGLVDYALIGLMVLGGGYAYARQGEFPGVRDAWLLEVRAPGPAAGVERFGHYNLDPDPGREQWRLTVTCGTVTTNGAETVLYRGSGQAGHDRWGQVGGTYSPPPGRERQGGVSGFLFANPTPGGDMRVAVTASGPAPCPSGQGGLSTGD